MFRCSSDQSGEEGDKLDKEIFSDIECYLNQREGEYALYFKDLDQDLTFTINEDLMFSAASVIKIPIMCELYRQVEADQINKEQLLNVGDNIRVGGAGILHELHSGIELSYKDLVLMMITLSDNTATNLLIDELGMENINRYLASYGFNTRLKRKMMDFAARKKGKENITSPREIGQLLEDIYKKQLKGISIENAIEIFDILSKQTIRDKMSFYIPEEKWNRVASKTGTLDKIEHDASIFALNDFNYILVIFSRDLPTNAYGNITIARVSQLIYKFYCDI